MWGRGEEKQKRKEMLLLLWTLLLNEIIVFKTIMINRIDSGQPPTAITNVKA